MKIAFTATGPTWESTIDPRFGRTDYLVFFNEETEELTSFDNRAINNVAHGAGPQTAQKIFEFAPDVLITGNGPGGNAASVLDRLKLRIITGAGGMTVKAAYNAFIQEGNAKP